MSSNVLFGGNLKKILLSLMVLGVVSSILGAGTFANFNATTANTASFTTSTLILSDKVNSGSLCYSNGGTGSTVDSSNSGTCDPIALAISKPGDSDSANITLKNEGSMNPSSFSLAGVCANTTTNSESYHGSGDLCATAQMTVQEYTDSNFTTVGTCVYGDTSGGGCAYQTIGSFSSATLTGGLSSGSSRYYKISVQLPSSADNTVQGLKLNETLTWTIAQ